MGTGYLRIEVTTVDDALPVAGAHVVIRRTDGLVLYDTFTDENGITGTFALSAPDKQYSLDPAYSKPAYSVCEVDVDKAGFVTSHIHDVEIMDTLTAILPVHLEPLADEENPVIEEDITIPPVGLLLSARYLKVDPPSAYRTVIIPDYITVHLGIPTNAAARNVRVSFRNYIKNVTSSEIYATWPHNSLVANIHAIVTFALNRVYTEWYRSRGFNFDITNSTSYDMYFRDGAQIFENVSRIVDEIFNVYARREHFRNPFFTQFCNGTTVTCPGLSQWGTVTLANQGRTPIEILHYFYPNDLELVSSDNITGITESYPGTPLRVGNTGESVRRIQNFLNRIRVNFPLIPLIPNPNGVFGTDTEEAVKAFQRTFNLAADGIVGRATWNKISFIHVGVIRLGELDSEGERMSIGKTPPTVVISQGSRGANVIELQFILNFISQFYPAIPSVIQDGVFGPSVKDAVIAFQREFNLTPDGIVGPNTWRKLYSVYHGANENAPVPPVPEIPAPPSPGVPQFPGTPLKVGSTGPDVLLMQTYLNTIRIVYPSIPYLVVDGIFGEMTRRSVVAFQQQFLLVPDGIIGLITWNKIVEQFMLVTGGASASLDFPGTPLRAGSRGSAVRLMQGFLLELSSYYVCLPPLAVDGIFGLETEAAVMAFQKLFGLVQDGIIGPITWYAIIRERNEIV